MTIYLDVIWALNFILDMMLLMLTQILAKDDTGRIRIMFGAFVASLLVPISLYYPHSFFTTIYGKILYSLLIILSSFRYVNMYRMVKRLLLFYFVTFTIGGGLIALHFLLQNPIEIAASGLFTFNSGYGDPISWIFVLIGFPIIWLFTKRNMDKHAIEKIRYDELYPVTIQMNHLSFSTNGYMDSGNQLVDPITKKPVIICDESFLKQWFTEVDWNILKEAHETLDFQAIPPKWEERIHIIPYQGVEGKSNFLLAIRPDQLAVTHHNEQILTERVLIGIQFATLTKDETYHCLLHPQIIKFGKRESDKALPSA